MKVVLFAWRLFRDSLPTKDSLLRRGVIASDDRLCVGGCGSVESSPRLFLHCKFLGKFGTLFIAGWASVRCSQMCLRITSISLVLLAAIVLRCDILFCI